jgi:hypothetical protein
MSGGCWIGDTIFKTHAGGCVVAMTRAAHLMAWAVFYSCQDGVIGRGFVGDEAWDDNLPLGSGLPERKSIHIQRSMKKVCPNERSQ